MSKASRSLQKMRGSGQKQRMDALCGPSEKKDFYPEVVRDEKGPRDNEGG